VCVMFQVWIPDQGFLQRLTLMIFVYIEIGIAAGGVWNCAALNVLQNLPKHSSFFYKLKVSALKVKKYQSFQFKIQQSYEVVVTDITKC
jgi:hypothetical protein